jgi:hypothetical protein
MTEIPSSAEQRAALRSISGCDNHDFTINLLCQVDASLWRLDDCQIHAAFAAMMGMKPRDPLEGMLIAQLIASHNAAMECCRRTMITEQTFEGRRENLNQANKLARTFAAPFANLIPRSRRPFRQRQRSRGR